MGTSTNGILFYGFPVNEDDKNQEILSGADEHGDYNDDEFDLDVLWAEKFGLDPKNHGEIWKHQQHYPVKIGFHCSDSYPMHYVAVRKSEVVSNRGYPKRVKALEVDPAWDKQIKDFCTKFGLKPPKEFGWWVASDMG